MNKLPFNNISFWRGARHTRQTMFDTSTNELERGSHAVAIARLDAIILALINNQPLSAIPEFRTWLAWSA